MPASPDAGTAGPLGLILSLNGAPVPDDTMIASVRITKDLGRIPQAVIAIQSDGVEIEDFSEISLSDFDIGSDVKIAAFYGEETEQTLFVGIVVSTRLRLDSQRGMSMELLCRDKALKLGEVRKSEKYDQKKDSDVMAQIIGDAGLTADVTATTDTWDQLRVDATDWDFLRLLADRNGLVINVEAGKVSVKKPDTTPEAGLVVTFGVDMLSYDATIDSQRMIAKSTYSAWDSSTQDVITGVDTTLAKPTLGDTTAAAIASVQGNRNMAAPVGAETEGAALSTFAKARMMRAGLDAIYGTCSFAGSGKIAPGDMLEIKDASDRFSGKAFVSGLVQQIEGGTWTTQVRMGQPLDWVSDTGGLGAAPASAVATPVPGLQIGVVVKRIDDPDNKQRIQIKLPLLADDGDTLVWARLAASYATNGAGIQFLPEIDDEVLVGFMHDDPNAAVILGSLHNSTAPRPLDATEENFIKTILTPELLKIEFNDELKILTLETPGGHTVVLDDDATMIKLEDSNGNTITMDDRGITLKSDKDITLEAGGKIDVSAKLDATVTGMNVTCEGDTAFTGKGGATAEVSGGGQTTIKGAMVMIN
jgi:phage protein D